MHATMMTESVIPFKVFKVFRIYIQNKVQNCMPREYSRHASFTYLPVLTGFFTATLLISNVLNCKIIRVGQLPFTGGLILFPLVALFGDVLTEVYGYAETRKVIWTGLTSLVLLVVMVTICGALPADPAWHNQAAFVAILGGVPRVAAASLIAYFVGEFCNSYVLAKYKIRTAGKWMSWRFGVSTALAQLIESGTLVAVAFTGRLPLREMFAVSFTGWAIMVTWEIAALPMTVHF